MSRKKPSLAVLLAPEDIRRGDYVAVLHEIEQWFRCSSFAAPEPISVRTLPENDTELLHVVEVCLPFVTAMKADRSLVTLDVRRHELARLNEGYARRVFKRMRRPRPERKSRSNDDDDD